MSSCTGQPSAAQGSHMERASKKPRTNCAFHMRGRRNFMDKWQNGRVYFKVKWNETLHTPFTEPLLLTQDHLIYRPQDPATVYTVTSPTPPFFVKSIKEKQCLSHMFSCSSSSFIRPHMEAQRVLCCLSFNHKTQASKLLPSHHVRTWMTHGHLSNRDVRVFRVVINRHPRRFTVCTGGFAPATPSRSAGR